MIIDLDEIDRLALASGVCPDCNSRDFWKGPRGGACVNIKCTECGSEFNVGPLAAQRISSDDRRSAADAEGGAA